MVCGGLFALTCWRQFGCRVFNFWHFSSRAGLHCEGAPGGIRACCGGCADNGTYGDIFERWVRHSLQIPFILLSFKDEGVRKDEDARVIAHDRLIEYILIEYFWLCAVFAELPASPDWLFQLHTLPSVSSYVQDDPITDLLTDCTFPHVSCVSEDKSVDSGTYFTLQDVFNASLKPTSYSLKWISGRVKPWRGRMLLYLQDAPRFSVTTLSLLLKP